MNILQKLFGTRMSFVEWNDYQAKVQFLDELHFEQNTREQSIKNMPGIGEVEE